MSDLTPLGRELFGDIESLVQKTVAEGGLSYKTAGIIGKITIESTGQDLDGAHRYRLLDILVDNHRGVTNRFGVEYLEGKDEHLPDQDGIAPPDWNIHTTVERDYAPHVRLSRSIDGDVPPEQSLTYLKGHVLPVMEDPNVPGSVSVEIAWSRPPHTRDDFLA